MIETVTRLIEQYRKSGLLIDTNLLLLLFMGRFSAQQIQSFKRTRQFTEEDYLLLEIFVERFEKIITTPSILTEVNSFSNQLGEPIKSQYFPVFAHQINLLDEIYTTSGILANLAAFIQYGLTDTGIFHTAQNNYLVLTDDLRLSVYLSSNGIDAINFNHLRDSYL
jgi:hypothetical protein